MRIDRKRGLIKRAVQRQKENQRKTYRNREGRGWGRRERERERKKKRQFYQDRLQLKTDKPENPEPGD